MIALLFLITISLLILKRHIKFLRQNMIYNFLEKNIAACIPADRWYSSIAVLRAAKKLNRLPQKCLRQIFADIKKQKFSSLFKHCEDAELKTICGKKAKPLSALYKAENSLMKFDFSSCFNLQKQIKPQNKTDQARLLAIEAALSLYDGDLESASTKINSAITIFNKQKMYMEEAQAYMLCGIIYKACALFDPAQLMLQKSIDLFTQTGAKAKLAEALGNLGMLMVQQNRYDEADDCFNKALKMFASAKDKKGMVYVYNQISISYLIRNDLKSAKKYCKEAQRHIIPSYRSGRALNSDIIAQIEAAQNKWKNVVKEAHEAEVLYKSAKNFSAMLEMMQLQAQALIKLKKDTKAEEILRNIIKKAKTKQTCFHIANAYNLLGVIFLEKGDSVRAKGLFNQALSTELYNERWCGAAIDYANIALTELRNGKKDEYIKNQKIALEYAKESGDEKLTKILEQRFSSL